MKLLNTVAASLLLSAFAATPAFAESGDNVITYISPSIIMIGTPDPCDDGGCAEEVAAVESTDTKSDSNAALVDAYGMPTSMPVIMRPSVDTPAAQASFMPAPLPAATTSAAPTPATSEPAPAATAEASAPVAPAEPAPAPVVQADAAPAKEEAKTGEE
jgi:pyruvate dehydrogenase E2 component (dihydrolipoamide acetyltransferase)